MTNRKAEPCLCCGEPVNGDDWARRERFDCSACERQWTNVIAGEELATLLEDITLPSERIAAWQAAQRFLGDYTQRRRFAVRERTA